MWDSSGKTGDNVSGFWLGQIHIRLAHDKMMDVQVNERVAKSRGLGESARFWDPAGIESDVESV
jgi:hypothetical protein